MPGRQMMPAEMRSRPHLAVLAELLATSRRQAELTVRDVAAVMNYSHSHVARAATCRTLPRWELVAGYLAACGVADPDLASWRRLWALAERKERARRASSTDDPVPDDELRSAIASVRKIVPLVVFVRRAATPQELGLALVRLGKCRGQDSLRKVEKVTGIPRATLHGWLTGRTRPSPARLDKLIVGLGATRPEQREFAQCLDRLTEVAGCDGTHPGTDRPCVLGVHTGGHRTSDGAAWLDDDPGRPRQTWRPADDDDDQRALHEWHDWYVAQLEPGVTGKSSAAASRDEADHRGLGDPASRRLDPDLPVVAQAFDRAAGVHGLPT